MTKIRGCSKRIGLAIRRSYYLKLEELVSQQDGVLMGIGMFLSPNK